MNPGKQYYPKKWRPTLGMIVTAMLVFVLALPLGGVWLFRFYDSQLVRETENELIAQGAFVAAIMKSELDSIGFDPSRFPVSVPQNKNKTEELRLIKAELDLSTAKVLPRRESALPTQANANRSLARIGEQIGEVTREAQRTTLAGFRLVDPSGIVIAGREEVGQSLAHITEVQTALQGNYASKIRERFSNSPRPPIYSISRGTDIRVFVAMPIEYRGKVAGVVYMSRTPSHFLRELFDQRWKLAGAAFFMLLITLAIAALFVRTIKGPIEALNERTKRIAEGDRSAITPLSRHGTKEIAELSQGLLSMSDKLQHRSDYIRTFANHVSHELKSPLTAIQGAAELLKDAGHKIDDEKRDRFLDNIMADTQRLTLLLKRLRDLAATETADLSGASRLDDIVKRHAGSFPKLAIEFDGTLDQELAISTENLGIIVDNMLENSLRHGATHVQISARPEGDMAIIRIGDNGSGISKANREKIFDLFFTTRRDHGGTGMGLSIVQSILSAHGGSILLAESTSGATFIVTLPLVEQV